MRSLQQEISSVLRDAFVRVLKDAAPSAADVDASFEIPKEEKFGDLSSNVVLKAAKLAKKAPRALADEVVKEFTGIAASFSLATRLSAVTVEGPGFINFRFSPAEIATVLVRIREEGEKFGKPDIKPEKILLEFVSANPTGPLTVAHGRQAALGDSLARILRFCGHDVTREYYNNDEGVQINTLGLSADLRAREILGGKELEVPENYYRGDYLIDIAKKLLSEKKDFASLPEEKRIATARLYARDAIMAGIQKDLIDFDVTFDNFYSQEELGKSGRVEKTLEKLKKKGVTKEEEGALWLESTKFGDDKDRVLIKSDKNYTYLTPDIAYHDHKFERGFEHIIDILGPDHHGYIARLKASQAALGHNPEKINVLIAQLVTLFNGTEEVRMSTRAGQFVTLRQILEEVGKDAGRFFFVMRKFDAHLDFDLALAKSQTPDNPVFYIQYAHARIERIKETAAEKGAKFHFDERHLAKLTDPFETRLLRLLSQYESTLLGAERTLEPYRLVPYLMELAAAFHRFYTENRVVTEDASLTQARLMLSDGVQTVIRTALKLLGVSAPLKM